MAERQNIREVYANEITTIQETEDKEKLFRETRISGKQASRLLAFTEGHGTRAIARQESGSSLIEHSVRQSVVGGLQRVRKHNNRKNPD